ncbi:MAG: hypothetical protein HYV63_28860, partial [Candidatus Schekmanbacteria bacterium]|nr:hypothetical protein [Candidatus Schekmanbacteria bacterium]
GYLPEGDIANPGAPAGSTLTFGIEAKPNFAFSQAKLELAFATSRFPGIASKWPRGSVPANQGDMIFSPVTAGAQTTTVTTTPWAAPWVDPFAARWTPPYATTPIPIGLDPRAPPATDADKVTQIPYTHPGEAFPDGNWTTPNREASPRLAIDPLADADTDGYPENAHPGDGLLAYDEFRGFVFGGYDTASPPHLRGEPLTKDLFLVNRNRLIGLYGDYKDATRLRLWEWVFPDAPPASSLAPYAHLTAHRATPAGGDQWAMVVNVMTSNCQQPHMWGQTAGVGTPRWINPVLAPDCIEAEMPTADRALKDAVTRNVFAHEMLHASSLDDHGNVGQCGTALECCSRRKPKGRPAC